MQLRVRWHLSGRARADGDDFAAPHHQHSVLDDRPADGDDLSADVSLRLLLRAHGRDPQDAGADDCSEQFHSLSPLAQKLRAAYNGFARACPSKEQTGSLRAESLKRKDARERV